MGTCCGEGLPPTVLTWVRGRRCCCPRCSRRPAALRVRGRGRPRAASSARPRPPGFSAGSACAAATAAAPPPLARPTRSRAPGTLSRPRPAPARPPAAWAHAWPHTRPRRVTHRCTRGPEAASHTHTSHSRPGRVSLAQDREHRHTHTHSAPLMRGRRAERATHRPTRGPRRGPRRHPGPWSTAAATGAGSHSARRTMSHPMGVTACCTLRSHTAPQSHSTAHPCAHSHSSHSPGGTHPALSQELTNSIATGAAHTQVGVSVSHILTRHTRCHTVTTSRPHPLMTCHTGPRAHQAPTVWMQLAPQAAPSPRVTTRSPRTVSMLPTGGVTRSLHCSAELHTEGG